jgi:hypothetical protein
MKRLLAEPLVHFLLAGGLLLAFVSFLDRDGPPVESDSPDRRIRVDAVSLRQFVQMKTGIEDEKLFEASYADLDAAARREWIDRFVREEALVREARRLGLDRGDDLIRRRLVQQIEFVALGVVESELEFGPKELERTYLARREDYRIPAALSFSHVFVRVNGADQEMPARARVEELLGELNANRIDAVSALGRGDRFLYNRNYVERTLDEVESHFGDEMADALGLLESHPSRWRGPFRSPHGFHLVLLTESQASRLPLMEEIRDVLHEDWKREIRDAALDRAVEEIVSGYEIEIDE